MRLEKGVEKNETIKHQVKVEVHELKDSLTKAQFEIQRLNDDMVKAKKDLESEKQRTL